MIHVFSALRVVNDQLAMKSMVGDEYTTMDFLGAFANFEKQLLASSCMFVRMKQLGCH
jgi:hypothetical protein